MSSSRFLTIWPVNSSGPAVTFGLSEGTKLSRSGGGTGLGGWQIVDRPRQAATTEWVDYSPFELDLSLVLDGYSDQPGVGPVSIEADIATVKSWELPTPGVIPPEPPHLMLDGPVDHGGLVWVVDTLTWKDPTIRDPQDNQTRWQVSLDLSLYQYLPPQVTVTQASPAALARSMTNPYVTAAQAASALASSASTAASGSGAVSGVQIPIPIGGGVTMALPNTTPYTSQLIALSTATYTVKTGDDLLSIASKQLGDWQDWVQIAQINGLRDPRNIKVGQVLRMPYVKGKNALLVSVAQPPPAHVTRRRKR